jgi:hypothetical protein
MRRIIIICEGQTEQEFCKDVLQTAFNSKNIVLDYPLIKKSRGGIVGWTDLKKQIELHLRQEKMAFVTTLIDFYGLHDNHTFPNWEIGKQIVNKNERMDCLEAGMKAAIDDKIRYRFIPYIQLHEFEALLFNDMIFFDEQILARDLIDRAALAHIIDHFPNPELINDTPNNAPSYRLRRLINGYHKIVYGAVLAECIGIQRIRNKCPRFNQWILNLEKIA